MTKKKIIVRTAIISVCVIAIIAGTVFGVKFFKSKAVSSNKEVSLDPVTKGNLEVVISGSAAIEPVERYEIIPLVNGTNKSTYSNTKNEITSGTDITFYGKYGDWDFAVIDVADDITPVLASKNYTGNEDNVKGIAIERNGLTVYRSGLASDLSEIRKNL